MDIIGDDLPWRKILAYMLEIRTRSQPSGVFRDFISKRWPLGGNPGSKFSLVDGVQLLQNVCLELGFASEFWLCIIGCRISSAAQLCPTLRSHGLQHARPLSITNSPSLLKLKSIESVMPSNHLILCHPFLLLPSVFPSIGSFPVNQFFASGGQTIGVSDSASVFPMNIQDWFPLGWTGWISLQSRGLSRVFNTTV